MTKKIFNIYFSLFLFSMINRELTPFGIDIRYICLLFELILIFIAFIEKRKIIWNFQSKCITLFYLLAFVSNIGWFFNDFNMNVPSFFVILFSYIFNFLSYLVFLLFIDNIEWKNYVKYLFVSLFVLIISMLYCIFIGDLSNTFLSTYSGRIHDISTNFLGGTYRIAGFAQDPNYASIFLILGFVTAVYHYKINHNKKMFILIALFSILYLFSSSKTILLALFIAGAYLFIPTKYGKFMKLFLIILVFLLPILIIFLDIPIFNENISMHQRLEFWNVAENLFWHNPLFGSGLTAFRSYFDIPLYSGWYVQCHSTIFQILSETGIVSLVIFIIIMFYNLKSENKYLSFLSIIFLIFMINTETLYHMYSIFFLGILPIIVNFSLLKEKEKKVIKSGNAIVFLVNSLCNGGAERVVANMANGYELKNKVFIITLFDQQSYKLKENVKVISLYNKKLTGKQKVLRLFFIVEKIDKIIDEIGLQYNISLITSHLIYSNLISRLSKYKRKIVHVIHVSYKVYDKKFHFLFRTFLQWLYKDVPIVTVSKGCENELIRLYKVKPMHITTIYNPININEIKNLSNKKIDVYKPYLLFVGRLDLPKRPDLMIDIFYQGKFYENYYLYMVGIGPYEQLLKNKIANYGLNDKVILTGWQSNVFPYMKNAKMLISCSKNEAFPMTMIEAFACDCPVVSFDIDYGPNEILVGKLKDYLVINNDIEDMIEKINKALTMYPKKLSQMASKFDISKINEQYIEQTKEWDL